jgi:ATP-dependent DNA helicase 2 subunit 2
MARVRKDEHVLARDDEEEMLLLDRAAIKVKYESQYQSQLLKRDDDEEDEDILLKPHTQNDVKHEESQAPDIKVDRGRAPGRIIGSTYPLEDFKINTARGNLVTKAVEDLAWVIQDIVTKPFASRRHKEMIECLQVLRATSLKVGNSCFSAIVCLTLGAGRRD